MSETASQAKTCAEHPDVETRLSCSQCETPICPKCMVMCDVGIKCQTCVNVTKSHALQVENRHLIISSLLAATAGVVFGFAHPFLTTLGWFFLFGVPVLGLILCYFLGKGLGALVHKAAGHKLGPTLLLSVTIGVVVGILSGPFLMVLRDAVLILSAVPVMAKTGTSPLFSVVRVMVDLSSAYIFILGLRAPFKV